MASQRIVSTAIQPLDDISREIAARLREFEAALRVVDALRAVVGASEFADRRGDALLKHLLRAEPRARASGAPSSSPADAPSPSAAPVDLPSRTLEALPVLVIATAAYRGRDQVGVVGLTADGQKRVVTFQDGSTADPVAMDMLVRELERRSLSPRLCITDGGSALDREIADSFPSCLIAHADPYVERAVLSHLADGPAQAVKTRLRAAFDLPGRQAEAELMAILADLRGRAPGTYQTLSRHLEHVLALRRLDIPGVLERSLRRGALVATCAHEARALGRRHTPAGQDLLYGVEAWEATTRRLIGHEHLPSLFAALSRPPAERRVV
ncbi:MAG: transposase [Firmicutes bacterium]|nr:transposase [Bacillota bacterium]